MTRRTTASTTTRTGTVRLFLSPHSLVNLTRFAEDDKKDDRKDWDKSAPSSLLASVRLLTLLARQRTTERITRTGTRVRSSRPVCASHFVADLPHAEDEKKDEKKDDHKY